MNVVAFYDDSAFAGVKGLGNGSEMDETAGKLDVGVGDSSSGVVGQDKEARDILWKFNASQERNIGDGFDMNETAGDLEV